MKKIIATTAILITTLPITTHALWYENNFVNFNPACGKFVFQLGGFYAHQGQKQTIGITDLVGDTFTVTHGDDGNGVAGVGYYLTGQEYDKVTMMYGIDAFYLPHAVVQGNIIQEGLFTNLSYRYFTTNYPVYVAAKAQFNNISYWYNITMDLGIGPNVIQTSHVKEKSLDGVTVPDYAFSGHTSTAFSAMAGIGFTLNNAYRDMPFECGYRFFYLGKGDFHKNSSQITSTLKTGNSYANALVCSLTI